MSGAKKSLAARGRCVSVATAECALPGAKKSLAARGRVSAPDVADVPAANVPDAAEVPMPVVSGAHESCAALSRKVSQLNTKPLTDRKHKCANCASMGFCTATQSSRSSSRGGGCGGGGGGGGDCGGCKKRCKSLSSHSENVATSSKKASRGSRVPMDAQKITPGPTSLFSDLR